MQDVEEEKGCRGVYGPPAWIDDRCRRGRLSIALFRDGTVTVTGATPARNRRQFQRSSFYFSLLAALLLALWKDMMSRRPSSLSGGLSPELKGAKSS